MARSQRTQRERPVVEPLHYTSCGLDDVYLVGGYSIRQTSYGEAISVDDLDGLHKAIIGYLISKEKILDGKTIRFLRRHLDLTQVELARLMGCDAQQVARYEKNQNKVPGPTDRLLRMLCKGQVSARDFLGEVADIQDNMATKKVFEATENGWRAAA
jgi:DNA-binding transcriptional regulator YiaG